MFLYSLTQIQQENSTGKAILAGSARTILGAANLRDDGVPFARQIYGDGEMCAHPVEQNAVRDLCAIPSLLVRRVPSQPPLSI
ncbi:hypothetical protein Ddc_01834 [Ditylenchus destructor]|nr:hypothetical protein Ddc_01834 [Ditylenchus destructor]